MKKNSKPYSIALTEELAEVADAVATLEHRGNRSSYIVSLIIQDAKSRMINRFMQMWDRAR